jgi:hypothetical protein
MLAGPLLSRSVCCGHWQWALPLHHCLAASVGSPMGASLRQRSMGRWWADPRLDLVWLQEQRFCCEPLFRAQKAGIFQLERSRLRDAARIDRLRLLVAIAVLLSSLQRYAVSLSGQRHRVDPHWQRGLSLARIGLHRLQQSIVASGHALRAWGPIPLQSLEPCLPGRAVRRRQTRPRFPRLDLPPPLPSTAAPAVA